MRILHRGRIDGDSTDSQRRDDLFETNMAVSRKASSKTSAQRPRKSVSRRPAADFIKHTTYASASVSEPGEMMGANVEEYHSYGMGASEAGFIKSEASPESTTTEVSAEHAYTTYGHSEEHSHSANNTGSDSSLDNYDTGHGASLSSKTPCNGLLSSCTQPDFVLLSKDENHVDMQYYSQSATSVLRHDDAEEMHMSTQSTISSSRATVTPMHSFVPRARQSSHTSRQGHYHASSRSVIYALPHEAPIYTADRFSACIPCRKRKIRCVPSSTSHMYDQDGNIVGTCATCMRRKKDCVWPSINMSVRSFSQSVPSSVMSTTRLSRPMTSFDGKGLLPAKAAILLPPTASRSSYEAETAAANDFAQAVDSFHERREAIQTDAHHGLEEDALLLQRFSTIQDDQFAWAPLAPHEQPLVPSANFPEPLQWLNAKLRYSNEPRHMPSPALTQSPGSSSKTFASPLPTPCDARFGDNFGEAMMPRMGAMQHEPWPAPGDNFSGCAVTGSGQQTWDETHETSISSGASGYHHADFRDSQGIEPALPSTQGDVYLASQSKIHSQAPLFVPHASMPVGLSRPDADHSDAGQLQPHPTQSFLLSGSDAWTTASTPPLQQQHDSGSDSSQREASPTSHHNQDEASPDAYQQPLVPAQPDGVYKDFIPSSA